MGNQDNSSTTLLALIVGGLIVVVVAFFAFGGIPGQKNAPASVTISAPTITAPAAPAKH